MLTTSTVSTFCIYLLSVFCAGCQNSATPCSIAQKTLAGAPQDAAGALQDLRSTVFH